MHPKRSGFTIIELAISVALIAVITSIALFSNANFSSRTVLSIRIQELAEYIRFAQERSASSEFFSGNSEDGFQVVRLAVRRGVLEEFHLERVASVSGAENVFNDSNSPFRPIAVASVLDGERVEPRHSEKYYIDACFIQTSSETQKYVREYLPLSVTDTTCSSESMLCVAPAPAAPEFSDEQFIRNNFDIHFSIEQPTREVYANIIPLKNDSHAYYAAKPNGGGDAQDNTSGRVSESYTGIRVVFIEPGGLRRSVDVYTTGLISTGAENSADGCPDA